MNDVVFFGKCRSCGKRETELDPDAGWCEWCCLEYAKEQDKMEKEMNT